MKRSASSSTSSEVDGKNDKKIRRVTTDEGDDNERSTKFMEKVTAHYNFINKANFVQREQCRILYLRNFNNWIKTMLISESVNRFNEVRPLKVLDLCCGKGGDFFKWAKLNVKVLVCSDIAENTLKEYESRYYHYKKRKSRYRDDSIVECQFILADCTKVRLKSRFADPSIQFDIVNCQFSFHYCFESLPQAENMLRNASESLKPGGFFIGTLPNSNEIVKKIRNAGGKKFKNDVLSVEMYCSEPYPLFGAKYKFYLENVVDCPEFLVHFPTFERLARKFGLRLIKRERFRDIFNRRESIQNGLSLLQKIDALEKYPPLPGYKLMGPKDDYLHAKIFCEENNVSRVGTLSKSEWEVTSLYETFVFEKVKSTINSEGYPQYEL